MPIASNPRMLLSPLAITLARLFHPKHISMRLNAMPIALRDTVIARMRLLMGWRPGQIVPPDLNVVVCKLAQLVVVHAQQLGFL